MLLKYLFRTSIFLNYLKKAILLSRLIVTSEKTSKKLENSSFCKNLNFLQNRAKRKIISSVEPKLWLLKYLPKTSILLNYLKKAFIFSWLKVTSEKASTNLEYSLFCRELNFLQNQLFSKFFNVFSEVTMSWQSRIPFFEIVQQN